MIDSDDAAFGGKDLATLIRKKYGRSYDVQFIKKASLPAWFSANRPLVSVKFSHLNASPGKLQLRLWNELFGCAWSLTSLSCTGSSSKVS